MLVGCFSGCESLANHFFENEICEDSGCYITFGNSIEDTLISLLSDEFKCWYSFREDIKNFNWWINSKNMENDIEHFLYDDKPMSIGVNGKKFKIGTIKELYDYLIYSYNRYTETENLTVS